MERILGGLAAAAVCGVGTYLFAETVDARYPVAEWLVWRLAPIWGYTVAFNVSCVAFGSFLLRRLLGERELPALERLLQSMMLGITAFVLALYGFGFVGLLKPAIAVAIPLVLLGVGWADGKALVVELLAWRSAIAPPKLLERVLGSLAIIGGAAALVFLYLEALDVSVINFDATWYHYPTAQDYARTGRILPFPGENHRAYPHLTSMVHTWALLVPKLKHLPQHWMLSLHLEYSIVLWRIVGGAALARWLLGGRDVRGLWAVFFLFPSIFVYDQSIGGSADHFLGFFAAPAALAAARALRDFDVRWGVLLGAALGGHMLVKYQAVYLCGAIGVLGLLRLLYLMGRKALRQYLALEPRGVAAYKPLLLGIGVIALTALLVSSPHFVKNAVFYKNPAYPFAAKFFTSSTPKLHPGYYQEKKRGGVFSPEGEEGSERQAWAFRKVFDYSFKTGNRNLTHKRPYMGALFSLLLPCALLLPRRRRSFFVAGMLVLCFMAWANTAANDRYLLSFYDLCIGMAMALMVGVWELGWLARIGLVPLVGVQLIWGGDAMLYYGRKELEAGLDLIADGYDGRYDERRFAEKSAQRKITEATPPDAVILSRNYKGLLGLNRTVVSDIRSASYWTSYSGLRDARDFYDMLAERGITHLMYPPGARRPTRWNNIVLWDELFHHYGVKAKRYGKLSLAELPKTPPPHTIPYLVLCAGLREYPDGIYKVEQLDVDTKAPRVFFPKPKPTRRFGKEETPESLADVRALAIGRGKLPKALTPEIMQDFKSIERLDGDELYLRIDPAAETPVIERAVPAVEERTPLRDDDAE